MTDEERAKADAAAGEKLDKILSCVDAMSSRLDALEAADRARKDAEEAEKKERDEADKARRDGEEPGKTKPEPVAADKSRKDGEESEEDKKAREDKARKDAEEAEAKEREEREKADRARQDSEAIAKRIAELESRLPKARSDADYAKMADAQARADSVYQAFGDAAPRPLDGETVADYERRLANGLKRHSARWKDEDIYGLTDSVAKIALTDIYADAAVAARRPPDLQPGQLREVYRTDSLTGARIVEFVGNGTFISAMTRRARRARIEPKKVA